MYHMISSKVGWLDSTPLFEDEQSSMLVYQAYITEYCKQAGCTVNMLSDVVALLSDGMMVTIILV